MGKTAAKLDWTADNRILSLVNNKLFLPLFPFLFKIVKLADIESHN